MKKASKKRLMMCLSSLQLRLKKGNRSISPDSLLGMQSSHKRHLSKRKFKIHTSKRKKSQARTLIAHKGRKGKQVSQLYQHLLVRGRKACLGRARGKITKKVTTIEKERRLKMVDSAMPLVDSSDE